MKHLREGTKEENWAEMRAKDRHAKGVGCVVKSGDAHWSRRHPERVPR